MDKVSIQNMKDILAKHTEVKLFFLGRQFIKIPIKVKLFENHMEFLSAKKKILDIEYLKIQCLQYEEIFRIRIIKFIYEDMQVALQIKISSQTTLASDQTADFDETLG